jgi:hypothetical protein
MINAWVKNAFLVAAFLVACVSMQSCQKYVGYPVQVRDAATHQPVRAKVEVGYPINVALARMNQLFKPNLRRDQTQTDSDGRALIRVAPDEPWFLVVSPDGVKPQGLSFNADLTPNESFGQVHETDGWLSTYCFVDARVPGVLQVKLLRP